MADRTIRRGADDTQRVLVDPTRARTPASRLLAGVPADTLAEIIADATGALALTGAATAAAAIAAAASAPLTLTGAATDNLGVAGAGAGQLVLSAAATAAIEVRAAAAATLTLAGTATATAAIGAEAPAQLLTLAPFAEAVVAIAGDATGALALVGASTAGEETEEPPPDPVPAVSGGGFFIAARSTREPRSSRLPLLELVANAAGYLLLLGEATATVSPIAAELHAPRDATSRQPRVAPDPAPRSIEPWRPDDIADDELALVLLEVA